ncbi:hypothetical protein MED121_03833 [Marinomonas sp. MED121]|uniref:YciI family protein n=1 Tax=Marinomonas sp. MED121 TaxID=314277 RepID=UPI000068FABA|nr:YciI family protein [Marinomonas sp. MED121]EAQ63870.1 hypothetical protein MED121_03833 [Marinomonas sp. MED121]
MFNVYLTFAENKALAAEFMQGHKDWIKQGVEEGVFLMVGSIKPSDDNPKAGGFIMAFNLSYDALVEKVNQDPFVIHKVVQAEIYEVTPNQLDDRLAFLMPAQN